MNKNRNTTIFFAYTKPKNFSGQTAASEVIISSLRAQGVTCVTILLSPLNRNHKYLLIGYFEFFVKQAIIIPSVLKLLFKRNPLLHLNLGQSYWSFLRVGAWFFPLKFFNKRIRVVISLHGSNFMSWESGSMIQKIFIRFLASSKIITVLGENQKSKLVTFGLSPYSIVIVPNTCSLIPVSDSFLKSKHEDSLKPIQILHLSLLIESKGFPLYLEALEILAYRKFDRPLVAILCGPITFSPYCKQFTSVEEKRIWIERKIIFINRISNGSLTVEWIPGATGLLKQKLFEDSHIFVFPTSFPVEAQPIVLLEALTTGCSIITSKAGEIPSLLNRDCAILLDKLDSVVLADEMMTLILNPRTRYSMAINGAKLINGHLSMQTHLETWNNIFDSLS